MKEKKFIAVVKCGECGHEIGRIDEVVESAKPQIRRMSYLVAICPTREHNSFPETAISKRMGLPPLNFNFKIDYFPWNPLGRMQANATPGARGYIEPLI